MFNLANFFGSNKGKTEEVKSSENQVFKNSIGAPALKNMILVGNQHVNQKRDYLNKINVFPVADGDTGSNMSITLNGIVEDLKEVETKNLKELCEAIIVSSLMHSTGNSGTVLSQFFKGFCAYLKNNNFKEIDSKILAEALKNANLEAYKSFEDPQKGTILDIVEAAAKAAKKHQKEENLVIVLEEIIAASNLALENTRNILPVVKKARVADSGAAGLVYMFTGFLSGLKDKKIITMETGSSSHNGILEEQDLKYRYCTESVFKINLEEKNEANLETYIKKIKSRLSTIGDSLQINSFENLVKIHIHTNQPESLKKLAEEEGEIKKFKADDMIEMQKVLLEKRKTSKDLFTEEIKKTEKIKHKFAVVTDASADISYSDLKSKPIYIAQLPVYNDKNPNMDISGESVESLYIKLKEDKNFVLKTSKASVKSYLDTIKQALSESEKVFCFPLSKNLSGTFNSAKAAKEMLSEDEKARVTIIDTLTASGGLTIMINGVFKMALEDKSSDEITSYLYKLRDKIEVFFVVDNLMYLERGGRISKAKSIAAKILGIKPLLALEGGKVEAQKEKKIFGNQQKMAEMMFKKIKQKTEKKGLTSLYFVYSDQESKETVQELSSRVSRELKFSREHIFILPLTLVIGAHTGPGSFGAIFY